MKYEGHYHVDVFAGPKTRFVSGPVLCLVEGTADATPRYTVHAQLSCPCRMGVMCTTANRSRTS